MLQEVEEWWSKMSVWVSVLRIGIPTRYGQGPQSSQYRVEKANQMERPPVSKWTKAKQIHVDVERQLVTGGAFSQGDDASRNHLSPLPESRRCPAIPNKQTVRKLESIISMPVLSC